MNTVCVIEVCERDSKIVLTSGRALAELLKDTGLACPYRS
jgi:hypothetical protein